MSANVKEILDQLVPLVHARTRAHLGSMLGVTAQTINNWVYRNSIPTRTVDEILRLWPQLNRAWLEGDRHALPLLDQQSRPALHEANTAMLLPDFDVTCGDVDLPEQCEGMEPFPVPYSDVRYIFPCTGSSMEPRIQDGDYVGVGEALSRFDSFRRDKLYLVITREGAMVKGVIDPGPDVPYLQLTTLNPDYRMANEGRLPKSDFRAAYPVNMIINRM